jgi:hypothetical protein
LQAHKLGAVIEVSVDINVFLNMTPCSLLNLAEEPTFHTKSRRAMTAVRFYRIFLPEHATLHAKNKKF